MLHGPTTLRQVLLWLLWALWLDARDAARSVTRWRRRRRVTPPAGSRRVTSCNLTGRGRRRADAEPLGPDQRGGLAGPTGRRQRGVEPLTAWGLRALRGPHSCVSEGAMRRRRRRDRWKNVARRRDRAAWKRLANRSERRTGKTLGAWLGRARTRPPIEERMMTRKSQKNSLTADQWNERFPVGTPVLYKAITSRPTGELTKTRSAAWTLGHGDPVVMVEGRSGGVALWALTVVEGSGAEDAA